MDDCGCDNPGESAGIMVALYVADYGDMAEQHADYLFRCEAHKGRTPERFITVEGIDYELSEYEFSESAGSAASHAWWQHYTSDSPAMQAAIEARLPRKYDMQLNTRDMVTISRLMFCVLNGEEISEDLSDDVHTFYSELGQTLQVDGI